MKSRRQAAWLASVLGLAYLLAGIGSSSLAQDKTESASALKSSATAKKAKLETAIFGAGCFWSTEAVFERVPGVKTVVSGYSGGNVAFPSYDLVCTGETGHAEVVQVTFDPSVVTYEQLVKAFFALHDPTTLNRQGDDFGTQYRSAIFYKGDDQKQAAIKYDKELTSKRAFRSPIVTELTPFSKFYPAEEYHQNYFQTNPYSQYSQFYIVPKLAKLKPKLHLQ